MASCETVAAALAAPCIRVAAGILSLLLFPERRSVLDIVIGMLAAVPQRDTDGLRSAYRGSRC